MRSTFAGLNTMVSGLNANQIALDTVGHNITNASNEGYSRQRANASATKPEKIYTYYGASQLGTGTSVESITRARDEFADRQYWKENSNLSKNEKEQYVLGKIETVFEEPSDTGFQTVLNKFWKTFQSLGTKGSDYSARVQVRDTAKELVNSINLARTQLNDLVSDNNTGITKKTESINQITDEIFELNKQIITVEGSGSGNANDLRDKRDLLVDQLSKIVNVNVSENKLGAYTINCGSMTLVNATANKTDLQTKTTTDPKYGFDILTITDNTTPTPIDLNPTGGEIKGIYDSTNNVIGCLDKLTTITAFLLNDFNNVHKAGFDLNNNAGINFFGSDGATIDYSKLQMNTVTGNWEHSGGTVVTNKAILDELKVNSKFDGNSGTDLIAAKSSNTEGEASGTNAVLLGEWLHKKESTGTLGGVTLDSYYTGFTGEIGTAKSAVDRNVENLTTVLTQITSWRESVSGVNWDEELTNMLKFQKGYSSSARVLTTMDEMLDKLINGTGVVGR